eukprot:m.546375 g.546375  ORF g.546375 m.546375 type:complete len:209 (+) comp22153_c0_seq1:160-786(+)
MSVEGEEQMKVEPTFEGSEDVASGEQPQDEQALSLQKPELNLPSLRATMPLVTTSSEGEYLEREVWGTLEPALEKLLRACRSYIPEDVRQTYPGGRNGCEVQRVQTAHDAVDFDPLLWLADYLSTFNPNAEQKYTPDSAATTIQCAFRCHLARKESKARRAERQAEVEAQMLAHKRNVAATTIQAAYRGHRVRLTLSLGRHAHDLSMC